MASSLTSRCLRSFLLLPRTQTLLLSSATQLFSTIDPNHPPKPPRPDSLHFDSDTVSETLFSYCNDWQRAFEFFNWVKTHGRFQHTTDTYNRMLDILGKFFEFDLSWDLIRKMNQNPVSVPDHTTFRVMFRRYASAHLVREAVDAYNRAGEFGLKDETTYSNLIDALCDQKHVVEAQDLCFWNNKELGFEKSTKIYNMILRGWFRLGWFGKCRGFWEEMGRRGVEKDLHTYSIYMDILCKSGKPWKAVKLYKEMKRKGMKLDVVAYNTVVRAVGLSEGVDFSIRVLKEMRELGCEPNVVTYNTIIKLLCENGRYREASKMLDKMPEKGCSPDVITYHCFFGSMQKPKEILRLFDRMIGSGVRPRTDTCVMLMRKFGRWGFLRPVLVVWKKMEELGCSPNDAAYNALIDTLIDKGMLDMARKYDEEMLAKGLSPKPRAELGTRLVSNGGSSDDFCDGYVQNN